MRRHEKFILTPIVSIIEDGCYAMSLLDDGLETFPLSEYMMQSLFLKMTGFQEQKVKCILWELATDDFELRYRRFKKDSIGEASSYEDKVKVFNDLVKAVNEMSEGNYVLITDAEREKIVRDTLKSMKELSEQSFMKGWSHRKYVEFEQLMGNCNKECLLFQSKKNYDFFNHCDNCSKRNEARNIHICKRTTLKQVYEYVYMHRNRCAHNTVSYQQNLPCLDVLQDENYVFENYFVRFALLMIIDKMFVLFFEKYIQFTPNKFLL